MQGINIPRVLNDGLDGTFNFCALFTGPMPASFNDLTFDPGNINDVIANSVGVHGLSRNILSNGNQSRMQYDFNGYSWSYLDGNFPLVPGNTDYYYSRPACVGYTNAGYQSASWRTLLLNRLGHYGNSSGLNVGYSSPVVTLTFGSVRPISRFIVDHTAIRVVSARSQYIRYSYASTIRVTARLYDNEGVPYDSVIGDYSCSQGGSTIDLGQVVETDRLVFQSRAGTGFSLGNGTIGYTSPTSAYWLVNSITCGTDSANASEDTVSPTWGLLYINQISDYSMSEENLNMNSVYMVNPGDIELPLTIFDIGTSGTTLETDQPSYSPINILGATKFNLLFSS